MFVHQSLPCIFEEMSTGDTTYITCIIPGTIYCIYVVCVCLLKLVPVFAIVLFVKYVDIRNIVKD